MNNKLSALSTSIQGIYSTLSYHHRILDSYLKDIFILQIIASNLYSYNILLIEYKIPSTIISNSIVLIIILLDCHSNF
jgi:hypothetical protein